MDDRLHRLAKTYAPYDQLMEFWIGYHDYQNGIYDRGYSGVADQAHDRGLEWASRYKRGLDA